MFERPHHQHIAAVLAQLNSDLLCENRCLFGGGTAIALAFGEYRESVRIDFMCDGAAGRAKAELAYGSSVANSFVKAKIELLERSNRLRTCMQGMGMTLSEAELRRAVTRLGIDPPARRATRSATR